MEVELVPVEPTIGTPVQRDSDSIQERERTPKSTITEEVQESSHSITRGQRNKARIQFISLCWCLVLAGWNDGTTGPLLPRIQEVYHVSFPCLSCCGDQGL